MSIDSKVRKPSQLSLDFMKRERTPKTQKHSPTISPHIPVGLRGISAGLVGIASLLAASYIAYANIPEGQPNVRKDGYTLEIESPTYSGNYLTRHFDGRTTVMLVGGLFSPGDGPYRWYKDTKGDGKVHEIYGDLGNLKREKDLMDNPGVFGPVFAEADRQFQETLDKYKPHIVKFDRDIQIELMF